MGDLRILRNVILHSKGVIAADEYRKLKILNDMCAVDQPIHVSYEGMHRIFVLIKQDCAKMLLECFDVKDAPIEPEEMADVAIQKQRREQP